MRRKRQAGEHVNWRAMGNEDGTEQECEGGDGDDMATKDRTRQQSDDTRVDAGLCWIAASQRIGSGSPGIAWDRLAGGLCLLMARLFRVHGPMSPARKDCCRCDVHGERGRL